MRAIVIAQATRRKQAQPVPAWQLYQGSQQVILRQGLSLVWAKYGFREMIDEIILSPWYGPLPPDEVVTAYDFGWKGRPRAEVAAHVRDRRMVERLQHAVAGYDLVITLLSRTYLAPLGLPVWVPVTAPQRWLFLASNEGLPFVPRVPNVRVVPAGTAEARQERVTVLDLKSHLFRSLCEAVVGDGAAALEAAWASGHV